MDRDPNNAELDPLALTNSIISGCANRGEIETIKEILTCYEQAFEQKINYDKSKISFSANVSNDACKLQNIILE